MNKQKLKNRQLTAKNKKIKRKEKEDSEGVRRKSNKPEMNTLTFYIIKGSLLIAILFSFFKFSTLLLPLFIAYSSLYYFSSWVERKINRQYNKENKKSLFKTDCALAFITIFVSIATAFYSFSTMVGNRFNSFRSYFYRIMSLSTGVRNKSGSSMGFDEKPNRPDISGSGQMSGSRPERPNLDLNDLPIEFAFNQILSSIIQILVFSVIILGVLATLIYFYKTYFRNKRLQIIENDKNEWTFNKEDLIKLLEEEI